MAVPATFAGPVSTPRAWVSLRRSLRRSVCLQLQHRRPLSLTPSLAGLPHHGSISRDPLLGLSCGPPRGGMPSVYGDRGDNEDGSDSLPSLGALAGALFARYSTLLRVAPVRTKALTSGILMLFSDFLAQLMTCDVWQYDRLLRFFVYGLLIGGPVTHAWYTVLDRVVSMSGLRAAFAKTALDQIFMSHVFLVLFFGFMHLAEGRGIQSVHSTVAREHPPAFFASLKLWPAVNMLNFAVVPAPYRVVFGSAVNVGWITFLSLAASASAEGKSTTRAKIALAGS